jgi:hypothetical protein
MDNRMTPELRAKLLNRLPFSRNSTIDYTPKPYLTKTLDTEGNETEEYDIPEEYRPIFSLRPMSVEDKNKMLSNSKGADEKTLRDFVRSCITNVSRFYDAGTMELIDFKSDAKGGMDKDQFENIPIMVIRDLFIYVSGISGLSPSERSGL